MVEIMYNDSSVMLTKGYTYAGADISTDPHASYDESTNTLTLNGITCNGIYINSMGSDFKIKVLGTNIIVPLMRAGSLLKESAAEMSIVTAVDVAACVASSAIIIVISKGLFKRNATRRTYFTALTVFMAILTMALLINYYNGFK